MDVEGSDDETVVLALWQNVFEVLNTLGERQPIKENFNFGTLLRLFKGVPDVGLFAGGKLIFPIEAKTSWNLPDDNIVEVLDAEDPPVSVAHSIMQVYGYMAHNKRRYGVLSTYDKTWFLWRPENDSGTLFISDVVKRGDTTPTLLRCFAHIMSLARQDSDCPFPPPSLLQSNENHHRYPTEKGDATKAKQPRCRPSKSARSGKGGHGSCEGNAGTEVISSNRKRPNIAATRMADGKKRFYRVELRLEKFDWDSFELTDVLGGGTCGRVFGGTLRGERVAVKLTDLWQHPELHREMLREARVYVELEKLQGHGISKLKGVGYTAGGLFALMTEFGGSPIEGKKLNRKTREMIVKVMASIHSEGFLHGDLKGDNILVEYCDDGPKITFIDFGYSRKFSSHKESVSEMAELKKMIRMRFKNPHLE
jgi:hypothetical protein